MRRPHSSRKCSFYISWCCVIEDGLRRILSCPLPSKKWPRQQVGWGEPRREVLGRRVTWLLRTL